MSVLSFLCTNCKASFDAEEPGPCPRCSSRKVIRQLTAQKEPAAPAGPAQEERPHLPPQQIRDGKGGWQDFHQSEVRQCLDCGNSDPAQFDLDWKHKEKTCKKCGAVLPLGRRLK